MDSLTQVVLGAAVGEATLGRKLGNRAMLWGGIAGTLPDLDVLSGLVTDPMSALAYHRAFTHSVPFALLAAPLIGWTVHRLYTSPFEESWKHYLGSLVVFWLLLVIGSYAMPISVYGIPAIATVITLVFADLCTAAAWWTLRGRGTPPRIHDSSAAHAHASLGQWSLLFFLCIVTHPLLDCFTAYGTQFFEPFTAVRLAWNTVSVVDPLYTLPFLLLLVLAARSGRGARVRSRLNTAGLTISSLYLLLTVVNHLDVGSVLSDTLEREGITARSTLHSPTLGNNLLWSGAARVGEDTYYLGQYSLLDTERRFKPLSRVEGRHHLLAPYTGDRELEILKWFTGGYYTIIPRDSGRVQLNDLRYGLLSDDPTDPGAYIFSWTIDTTARPVKVVEQPTGPSVDRGGMLMRMWSRLKGI